MPDYLTRPVTQLRRKDRALTEIEWMDRLLALAPLGHLAVIWNGQPSIHSNYFWYDANAERVYWHTAGTGRLRAMFEAGVSGACFTVSEFGRLLPADTPFDFSTEYASVVLYGPVTLVADTNMAEKRHALDGIMAKYAPHLTAGVDYAVMPDGDITRTSVYSLSVEQRVGKHNVKPTDFRAYPYPGGSFIDLEREASRLTVHPKELDEA